MLQSLSCVVEKPRATSQPLIGALRRSIACCTDQSEILTVPEGIDQFFGGGVDRLNCSDCRDKFGPNAVTSERPVLGSGALRRAVYLPNMAFSIARPTSSQPSQL